MRTLRGSASAIRSKAVRASLSLDFVAMAARGAQGTLDPRIAFSRASTATRLNAAGLVESIASGVARFSSDATTGKSLGLLLEDQRTNLCLWSDDLTNAVWVKMACTTAKTATGADGAANSASILTATLLNATCLQSITAASASRVQSCWIKRRTGTGAIYMTQDNGTTWTTITVGATWALVNIPAATLANPTVGWMISVMGDEVDVQFAQNELGSVATSAIPTTSSAATCLADITTIKDAEFLKWFNQKQGTFVVSYTKNGPQLIKSVVQVSNGSNAAPSSLYLTEGGTPTFLYYGDASTNAQISSGYSSLKNNVAASYFGARRYGSINGNNINGDSISIFTGVGSNKLDIGSAPAGTSYNIHSAVVSMLDYYPVEMSAYSLMLLSK